MLEKIVKSAVALLLLSVTATSASATNSLEITIDRAEGSGSILVYSVSMTASKDIAATCELVTPTGNYSFIDMGYVGATFSPDQAFYDDYANVTFAELTAALSGGWTLTFDAGFPNQTVVHIDFGTVLESDFPRDPTLTAPQNGVPIKIPGAPNPPTIEWTYGPGAPCDAQPGRVEAAAFRSSPVSARGSGYLPCNSLSWTPEAPLESGTWLFVIFNLTLDYRQTPNGIDVMEGSWGMANDEWLCLRSSDWSQNDVVPTKAWSWGVIKALYR